MTARAFRISCVECTADVTTFAGNVGVRAVQYKTCAEMIKCRLRVGVARRKQANKCYAGKREAINSGFD